MPKRILTYSSSISASAPKLWTIDHDFEVMCICRPTSPWNSSALCTTFKLNKLIIKLIPENKYSIHVLLASSEVSKLRNFLEIILEYFVTSSNFHDGITCFGIPLYENSFTRISCKMSQNNSQEDHTWSKAACFCNHRFISTMPTDLHQLGSFE